MSGPSPSRVQWLALGAAIAAALIAGALASSARAARQQITARLIQEATWHLPNQTYRTSLRLFAVGSTLGKPDGTFLGVMSFTWKLNGSCSSSAASCSGTADLKTVTTLPGGTISASGQNLSVAHGFIVPIQGGTGAFKGASGNVQIAPNGAAEDVFNLTLP